MEPEHWVAFAGTAVVVIAAACSLFLFVWRAVKGAAKQAADTATDALWHKLTESNGGSSLYDIRKRLDANDLAHDVIGRELAWFKDTLAGVVKRQDDMAGVMGVTRRKGDPPPLSRLADHHDD